MMGSSGAIAIEAAGSDLGEAEYVGLRVYLDPKRNKMIAQNSAK